MSHLVFAPSERPRDECGVFGVFGHPEAAQLAYLGLYALQHRGQESAGIVTSNGRALQAHKGMGLVGDIFTEEVLAGLDGHMAIGHVRYSTLGASELRNAQPITMHYAHGPIAVAHNGNLTNARALRDELEAAGSIFQSTAESEMIIHLMATQRLDSERDALTRMLHLIEGAFSLVILKPDVLVGLRDPHGWRPLSLGRLDGAYILTSETCALDLLHAEFVRELEPGEVVVISESGLESFYPFGRNTRRAHCIFELIYFARPDSRLFGEVAHLVRKRLGAACAREHPVEADLVIPIPDSGNSAAIGYAEASGIPFDFGITRNHYIGRTFIQPQQAIRDFGVRVKLNPVRDIIAGKRVVVVEDSIVRGTTTVMRMNSIREAGAKQVHLRVSCPPIQWPCHYGIDFATREELIAANKSVDEIREFLGVDSLGYLSKEGMLACMKDGADFCTACFDGNYPVAVNEHIDKFILESDRRQRYLRFS
jgi:amidophosphoribosyltransferase